VIDEYSAVANGAFDLSPIRDALDALQQTVDGLYSAIASEDIDPATANDAIVELSRTLVRLNFTERGQFDQDPTTTRPPYPRLSVVSELEDSEREQCRALETHLRRRRNAIVHAIHQTEETVDALLSE